MSLYRKARKNFLEAVKIAFQQTGDPELDSPNIKIEPQESLIQKAVDLLKREDPSFFQGVRKIVSGDEPNYGHVESGPGKDHTVIHVNFPRISREVKQKMQGAPQEEIEKEIARQIGSTIAHERGHVFSFHPEMGFQGGESPAEQAEQAMMQRLRSRD